MKHFALFLLAGRIAAVVSASVIVLTSCSQSGGGGEIPPSVRQPKVQTGAEYYYNWLIPNIGTVDRVEPLSGEITTQNAATLCTSETLKGIIAEHKTLETYVTKYRFIEKHELDKYTDLPTSEFLTRIEDFQEGVFGDNSGMDALTVLVNAGVDNADKALYIEYVKAFTGMNLLIGQEGSNEDYSTKFNVAGTDVSLADVLVEIQALGGISLNPTGPYQIDAVRDAAIALLSNENNKLLAKDVYTQVGSILSLRGLVNNIISQGFYPNLNEEANGLARGATGLDSNYMRQYGVLAYGAFKPQEMQQEPDL